MPPFTVLHVCMGNICRSPMAERLFDLALRKRLADTATDLLVYSHSAGTGGWHAGEEMNPPAARQIRRRGGDADDFTARKLRSDHVDAADLVLTATADQRDYVVALRPDATARTFVLGEFGRLAAALDGSGLPAAAPTPEGVYKRGVAIVAAVDAARGSAPALETDDLDDPWGRGDQTFTRIGDEIDDTAEVFARLLLP